MRLTKYQATVGRRKFVVEEILPGIGWYLHVWENEKAIADHLQNDFDTIIERVRADYGVPIKAWRKID